MDHPRKNFRSAERAWRPLGGDDARSYGQGRPEKPVPSVSKAIREVRFMVGMKRFFRRERIGDRGRGLAGQYQGHTAVGALAPPAKNKRHDPI